MKQWIIRRSNFSISRPLPQSEIEQMILEGTLTSQDEICAESGHWFTLNELQEVRAYFGDIDLKKVFSYPEAEITSSSATSTMLLHTQKLSPEMNASSSTPLSKKKEETPAVGSSESSSANESVTLNRPKAILVAGLFLGVFILILILLWSGSY